MEYSAWNACDQMVELKKIWLSRWVVRHIMACIFGERQETDSNAGPRARKIGRVRGCILAAWGCIEFRLSAPSRGGGAVVQPHHRRGVVNASPN